MVMKLTALLTTLCLGSAATATAQEINIRSMDEACRTDPALKERCLFLQEGQNITWGQYVSFRTAPHNGDPDALMEYIRDSNGWTNASIEELKIMQIEPDIGYIVS